MSSRSTIQRCHIGRVFERIEYAARRLRQIQQATISAVGLTPAQLLVLRKLWERDGQPLKDLASAVGCTRATITGVVDTLEAKTLVVRRPNPADRRSLLAFATASGLALRSRVPELDQLFGCCCGGLSEEELRALDALLEKLAQSLGTEASCVELGCGKR